MSYRGWPISWNADKAHYYTSLSGVHFKHPSEEGIKLLIDSFIDMQERRRRRAEIQWNHHDLRPASTNIQDKKA